MGESAGAVAVLLHLVLPASGPGTIFQSAAVHSAPCVAAPHELECVSSLEKARRTVASPLAAAAGCDRSAANDALDNIHTPGLDNGQLECLRALPVEMIVDLTRGLRGAAFHPVFGVGSVPTDPIATLTAEGTPVRRIIVGWNKHDGTQFAPGSWAADSETNATHCCPVPIAPVSEAVWTEQLQTALGRQPDLAAPGQQSAEIEAQARALYSDDEGHQGSVAASNGVDRWWQLVELITDIRFSCPTLRIAEILSGHYATTKWPAVNQGDGVRVYQFNQRSR
jgi:hypothetical protein